MFESLRKKLAQATNEEEEITFKPYEEERITAAIPEVNEEPAPQKNTTLEGNMELKVVRPESMEEIFTIADYLIDGCTVVLNLEILDRVSVTRMLDFLNGVTYTTGGEVKNVSQGTYIITPSGINVEK